MGTRRVSPRCGRCHQSVAAGGRTCHSLSKRRRLDATQCSIGNRFLGESWGHAGRCDKVSSGPRRSKCVVSTRRWFPLGPREWTLSLTGISPFLNPRPLAGVTRRALERSGVYGSGCLRRLSLREGPVGQVTISQTYYDRLLAEWYCGMRDSLDHVATSATLCTFCAHREKPLRLRANNGSLVVRTVGV